MDTRLSPRLAPDDSQLVTLTLESGYYLLFLPDTGAQCNVVPLHLYKKARVTPVNTAIISYGGTSIPVLGKVHSRVWRRDFRCLLNCNLVESKRVRPILVIKACLGMNIITYQDNDQLNRPQASEGGIYTQDAWATSPVSAYQLFKRFPDGVGALAGEYHMVLDKSARPVQHPPRRVPSAIRERRREILEDLEKRKIIARVTTPTP